jgi:hypothetical protein
MEASGHTLMLSRKIHAERKINSTERRVAQLVNMPGDFTGPLVVAAMVNVPDGPDPSYDLRK